MPAKRNTVELLTATPLPLKFLNGKSVVMAQSSEDMVRLEQIEGRIVRSWSGDDGQKWQTIKVNGRIHFWAAGITPGTTLKSDFPVPFENPPAEEKKK